MAYKSKAQRDAERQRRLDRAWPEFRDALVAAKTFDEAQRAAYDGHRRYRQDELVRSYYTNLLTFLEAFEPPNGATIAELDLYSDLFERLVAGAEVKPEAVDRVRAGLSRARNDGSFPRFGRV